MSIIRVISGLVSLGVAGMLAFHLVIAFRPIVLPTLRELGKEQNTYFIMHVAGFSLTGSQIIAFEAVVTVVCLLAAAFGIYLFSGYRRHR